MDINSLPAVDATEASLQPGVISDVKHYVIDADGNRVEVSEEEVLEAFTNEGPVATGYVEV